MNHSIAGSIETLNSLQITEEVRGLDAASKEIIKNKEILAVILKHVINEYQEYTYQEVMEFIEADSINTSDVSPGRTNTRIKGEDKEFQALNEKVSYFDILLTAVNPKLSDEKVIVKLHIDVEAQKDYKPGYPIEKRGIYYLTRELSSQLSPVITEETDYSKLEKCYSIWMCVDNIAQKERYSISYYDMENTKNIGECNVKKEAFDLLSMVIIRLGSKEYSENVDVLKFLNLIMYPERKNLLEDLSEYIDFSNNEELKKEVLHMSGLGLRVFEDGIEEGMEKGIGLIVNNMLKQGYTCSQIAEITGVPLESVQEIEVNDMVSM